MSQAIDRSVAGRKLEHLRAIENDAEVDRRGGGFDRIALTHRALPELDLAAIDSTTEFLGKPLRFPLLISSMTGGSGDEIMRINRNLAQAAEQMGVAMAVGSQRVMFTTPESKASFALREFAPSIPLVSNIGAVQLNEGVGVEQCLQAIDILRADGLYLHLNPLQEAVQPEGDRDFTNLAAKIADLVPQMPVPVLIKEVGCGLAMADIRLALDAGVRHFDVAGRGGTSWSRIEYHRRQNESDDLGMVFQDWGLPTIDCLREGRQLLDCQSEATVLIASGGIRNGIDMAKCLILGADLCGVAAPFLKAAQQSVEAVIESIEKFYTEFRTAMFLMGCSNLSTLQGNHQLIRLERGAL
ncbi:MAG: type 2 isopentenyl-diphosphate Delta-isomerase [Proteobacteria bacterium]|nr:MAG: type 2 isopentenyl-diphosphate Delta-isomerase [Pseudomonadota bacterium]